VMSGTKTALLVGNIAVGIGLIFGIVIGSVAGYIGGWIVEIMMRMMYALVAFPCIIITLMFVGVLLHRLVNSSIAIGLMTVPGIARIARSGFIQNKEFEYVLSAKLIGAKPLKIMFRHILPNVSSPLIVAASIGFATAMLAESGLS